MKDPEKLFNVEFGVRDYECDLQGVVNNANYQHYFEHARHEFLVANGISFAQLHEDGVDLIVIRVEIEYKLPLKSRDRFIVTVDVKREGHIRIVFDQEIFRLEDMKTVARARTTTAAVRNGKPVYPAVVISKLGLE